MTTELIGNGLAAAAIALSLAPVPGLALIPLALKQMLAHAEGMRICRKQATALHNQAQDLYKATKDRYSIIKKLGKDEELQTIDGFVQGLHTEIECINNELRTLAKKPWYHVYLRYESTSAMLTGHKDALTTFAGNIVLTAVLDQSAVVERMMNYLETHEKAIQEDRETNRQVEEESDRLNGHLQDSQEAWKAGLRPGAASDAKRQAVEARVTLYQTRHNLSLSGLALPIAEMDGEVERRGKVPVIYGSSCDIWEGLWLKKLKVALKVHRGGRGALTQHEEERLERQINLWRTMKHPNILTLLGVCRLGEASTEYTQLFFVSPWVPNRDAPSYLKTKPCSGEYRMRIIHDMALGLKYLHDIGYVHGGLQGSNVLVSNNESALLSDFRLTKQMDANLKIYFTHSNSSQNCYRWMSPEALSLEEMTPACDVWSFAMTALQLLSDKEPYWPAKSILDLTQGITTDNKKPAREDHPSAWIDDRMWGLLTRCWESDPKTRLKVDDVIAEVEAIRREKYRWNGQIIKPEDLLAHQALQNARRN